MVTKQVDMIHPQSEDGIATLVNFDVTKVTDVTNFVIVGTVGLVERIIMATQRVTALSIKLVFSNKKRVFFRFFYHWISRQIHGCANRACQQERRSSWQQS